jgi:hypothetical protein
MSKKEWLLAIVLVDFIALTLFAVFQMGFVGLFETMTMNIGTILLTVDLTIALSLIGVWMWNDARDRGISPLPYLGLMLISGSVGPLLYLLRTARRAEPAAARVRLAAGAAAK